MDRDVARFFREILDLEAEQLEASIQANRGTLDEKVTDRITEKLDRLLHELDVLTTIP